MNNFVILDLRFQANAVWDYVGKWTTQEVLAWLSQRGSITLDSIYPDTYWFRSGLGIETCFRLSASGEFFVYLGDHVFHRVDGS